MDRKWWTLIAVCIGTFMLLVDVTIVNVALPNIQTSLKSSFSDLQWVVDAYALMLAALLLTTGSLADIFGRRRVFVVGLCIFTASSLLSGLATTPLFLNLARGAQGVGAAAMFSTSLALLASSFRGRERGMAFGVWGGITGLAVAVGPVVGGALTTGFGWRWIFLVNVPIGVIGVAVALLRVEESRQPGARRPDWLGALTFSGALAALVYALIQGEGKGWTSNEILACLVGAGVLLLVFVILEFVQKAPMFDLSLFRNPTFAGGSIVAFSLSAGMFALLLYLTLYLQDVLGFSALDAGLRLLFLSGGILLTSTLAGRLTTRVSIRFLIAPGLVLVGVGLMLMRGLKPASGWEHLIPGFVVAGAGVGMINPPLASTAVGVVEPARAGMASGINSTFRQVGIATGIAGLGAIFSHTVRTKMISLLAVTGGIPQTQAHAIAANVAQGSGVGVAISSAPPGARTAVVDAVRVSFVGGLNQIFLIAGILSFGAALLSVLLIRNKDFEASAAYHGAGAAPAGGPPPDAPSAGGLHPVAPAPAGPPAGGPPEAAPPAVNEDPEAAAAASARPDTAPTEPSPPAAVGEPPGDPPAASPTVRPAPLAVEPSALNGSPRSVERPATGSALKPRSAVEPRAAAVEPRAAAVEPRAAAVEPRVSAVEPRVSALGPAPTAPALAALAERSYAVALAAEQAQADCSRYVEWILARLHATARGPSAPTAGGESPGGKADRVGALRDRLNQLADERQRLVGALRGHTHAVGEHAQAAREHAQLADRSGEHAADTRRDLYGLIAALATLTDEARAEATAPDPLATHVGRDSAPDVPTTD